MHSEIILDLGSIFMSIAFSVGSATNFEYADHCMVIIAYAQTSWSSPFINLPVLAFSIASPFWYQFV